MQAALLNIPRNPAEWNIWSFNHKISHDLIRQGVLAKLGIPLTDYEIDPTNPDDMSEWLQRHSQLHVDMDFGPWSAKHRPPGREPERRTGVDRMDSVKSPGTFRRGSEAGRSLIIGIEHYADVIEDLKPLLAEHHAELALYKDEIPLDPNFDLYFNLDRVGLIRCYTVRLEGVLVGYAIFSIVARHLHYAHRWAINDIIWIHPDHRNFGIGSELCDVFEADLARNGPIVIHIETKESAPELAMLLRHRGYGTVGVSLSKRFA